MRIAALLTGLYGYQEACYAELGRLGDEVLLVHPTSVAFQEHQFQEAIPGIRRHPWTEMPSAAELIPLVADFQPDVIIMSSWSGRGYRAVMRHFRGRALRVLFTSNFWHGTWRQYVGVAVHDLYVNPLFDCAWVPGERSEAFARRLGFRGRDIIRGANSADVALYDRGRRDEHDLAARRQFLFTGRLIWHKGPSLLAEAYADYRDRVENPWSLSVAGTGPLAADFEGRDGVTLHGFVQPAELAELMHRSSCLVHPAHIEWYGVVLHEAATAGLPIISSDGVGAVPHLLQDGFNGWTVEAGNKEELVQAMARMSTAPPSRMAAMSEGSRALGSRLSPTIWARNLHEELERRLPGPTGPRSHP